MRPCSSQLMAIGVSIIGSAAKSSTLNPGATLNEASASSGVSGFGGGSLNLISNCDGPAFCGWTARQIPVASARKVAKTVRSGRDWGRVMEELETCKALTRTPAGRLGDTILPFAYSSTFGAVECLDWRPAPVSTLNYFFSDALPASD